MARKIRSIDELPVDPVEAVKRGFIHRGFIPRKYRRNSQLEAGDVPADRTAPKSKSKPKKTEAKPAEQEDSSGSRTEEKSMEASQDPKEQDPGEVHEKLVDVTVKAQDELFRADTVFPFTLFPDTITLDREKLTVATRAFFRVAKIVSVPVSTILSAEVDVGPFFGSVHMTSKFFSQDSHSVKYLWRHDAVEIQRLLQGFIIAHEKDIDVAEIEKEDLIVLLNDLGQGVSD